jgi:hypothetical protein
MPQSGRWEERLLLIKHFFWALQLARAGANTQALEEGNIELRVDAAVEISTRSGYATLALQCSKMLGTNAQSP